MTSMPDGCSAPKESPRQVMVVEDDAQRRERLCTLLRHHGLTTQSPSLEDLAMETQTCNGIIIIGRQSNGVSSWTLAQRIRTFNPEVPILLWDTPLEPLPNTMRVVQSCLPEDISDEQLMDEIRLWLRLSPEPRPRPKHNLATILLVDDDLRIQNILCAFLQLKGFRVLLAQSGDEALEQLKRITPNAVLLDMCMPGMNGILTLKHIRITYPNLPVIVVTSLDEDQTIAEAEALGAHNYLVKPFNLEHLEALLLSKVLS